MQGEMEGSGRRFDFLLWLGSTGTSGDLEPDQAKTLLIKKDYVLSPLTDVERFQSLINMKQYQCAILQIADHNGEPVSDPLPYALYLNNLPSVYNFFITGENNKEGIFHTHALLRTGQRTDALRRSMTTAWDNLLISHNFREVMGTQQCTVDILKLQRCQKPSSLAAYMMKGPQWVMASDERMLQYAYDLDLWELNARFKPKEDDEPETAPDMNVMTKELIDLIIQNGCKTIDDCMKHGPLIMSKYLHKPGLQSIVQNCLTFVKSSGSVWSLNMFENYEPDPEPIHKILLHQGINPTDFDLTIYTWLTKQSGKRNCLVLWGPTNTGKSAFIAGLKQIVPWGEITNGSSGFNFEGLLDVVIGVWEEPLISVELAEKCKQVFEGMTTSIAVKYKKPHMLSRIPILITTNHAPWRFCTQEEPMFRNRMYIFDWVHNCKDEHLSYRTVEYNCKCRFCEGSRCWAAPGSSTSICGLQTEYEPISPGEQPVRSEQESDVGTGPMSTGDERASGGNNSPPGSSSSCTDSSSTNTSKPSSTTSSTAERHMGQFRIIRPGSNERRDGGSNKHVESDQSRGCDGDDSTRDGTRQHLGKRVRGHASNRAEHESPNTLGSWLARANNPSKNKSENKKAKVVRLMDTKIDELNTLLTVPTQQEWRKYLSYLFHWHG